MNTSEDVFRDLEPLDNRLGALAVLASFTLFHMMNTLVNRFSVVPHSSIDDPWRWRNLLVSWVHGGICGPWVLSCFVIHPEMVQDLVSHHSCYSYYLVAFSSGYFLFDFTDMIRQGKVIKLWELTLHHIAVTSMFLFNVYQCRCIAYNVVALLAEVNSFFLHSRKLLQMMGYKNDDPLYKANAIVNLLTFVCGRGVGLVWITVGMYWYAGRVTAVYWWTLACSMFVMNGINPVLFWRLLYNDFLRKKDTETKTESNGFVANGIVSNGSLHSSKMNNNTKKDL